MIGFLAIIRAGGVAVLVNSRGAPAELRAAVEECTPALVLVDEERAALLRDAAYPGRVLEALDFPATGRFDRAVPAANPDDPAAILFTSGTTGRVKGAVLTHRNLITGLMSVQLAGLAVLHNAAQHYGVTVETILASRPQYAVLVIYPLFHISGLGSAFLSPMLSGGKVVIMRRWDPEEALRLIAAEKITAFTGVPTMMWDILNRAKIGAVDISSLNNIGTGGQALPINLREAVQEAVPHAFLGTGFGLTETAGAIAMALGADFLRKREAAGRVLTLAEVRVHDEAGRVLPPGSTGEIAVRGPMVMKGYWNRPEETAAVLDGDGWFRTGDIGRVDEEGYIFIVDRKKDMVISGGENIYCAEVERAMSELPQVAEGAAFGLPDERLGEKLVAVVLAEGLTEDEVRNHIGETLARYKAPVRVAFARAPLPRNAVGKVDKIRLRAMWPELSGDA
jgi:acyl-CoA synthetase (AMP-forming)/AMP-acid ligase II